MQKYTKHPKKTDASKFFKKTDPSRVFKKPTTTGFLGFFLAAKTEKAATVKSLGCNPGYFAFCKNNHATQAAISGISAAIR
jgi:hypothetical protein